MSRILLVGAGYISRVHAEALAALPGHSIAGVADPDEGAARRLAQAFGAAGVYASAEDALAADGFDRAHVLVPPPLHGAVAGPLLRAGKPVLLEKPLAVSTAECDGLQQASEAGGAALGVNQNFVHHPAFAGLREMVRARKLGPASFVTCLYNVPLKQMQVRQFGHWMFHEPGNILLEQAVHPLSQIVALAGEVEEVQGMAGPSVEVAPGLPFYPTLNATLRCRHMPAQLRFAVGQSFPIWQVTAVCEDGTIVADILANRLFTYGRTRWLEAMDLAASGLRTAGAVARHSVRNLADYALSMAKLKRRSDAFFVSMRGSIAAFHGALDEGRAPELDGRFGAHLVSVCEQMAAQAFPAASAQAAPGKAPALAAVPAPARDGGGGGADEAKPADVAVLGGTGFIGTHTVQRLVDAGLRVSVMARGGRNLPAIFAHPNVTVHRGNITREADVARAVGGAPAVVNLAHGGGGETYEQIRAAMVGGAETVARVCLAQGVKRLVYVGSIASLYLGPQAAPITGETPPDPEAERRADYSRAKAECDRLMLEMHAKDGLPVVILRPGLVVGEGGLAFHSGVGLYNNDQHCVGWNAGRNPLPFVLVEDVAEAVLQACRVPGIEGRAYNLVGDVRPTAREYVHDLGQVLGRPLRFHPQNARQLWLEDMAKWSVKRATGRGVPAPTLRDLVSRGLEAAFDCTDAKRDLGWTPVSDPARFRERAIEVHAPRSHARSA